MSYLYVHAVSRSAALRRSTLSTWSLVAASAFRRDPFEPAVHVVAVIEEPAYSTCAMYRAGRVIRPFDPNKKPTRAELGNVSWRDELLEYAALLDRLQPYDLEAFCCNG
jgi:hypothetical protein